MEWWEKFFDEEMMKILFPEERWEVTENRCESLVKLLGLEPGSRILDLACGTGRYSIALAKRGYEVVGLDFSEIYIEKARKKAETEGVRIDFLKGDMRDLPFDGEFDAVLCLWTSFGYFEREEDHLKALKEARRALRPSGRFLLDISSYEALMRNFRETDWYEIEGGYLLDRRKWVPEKGRLESEWILVKRDGVKKYEMSLRLFTAYELIKLAREAGLVFLALFGDFEGNPKTLDSRRTVLLFEKG